jgi:large repetitive protein
MTRYLKRHDGSVRRRTLAVTAVSALVAALATVLLIPAGGVARSQAAPVNTALPTISGNAVKDSTLSATTGTWTGGGIGYSYQWLECDTNGANCSNISGATNQTYVLSSGEVGNRIRVEVTATNSDGTAAALSDPTDVVVEQNQPVNTSEPKITGSATEGSKLVTSNGDWTGSPTDYDYEWVRCGTDGGNPDGSNCSVISGAHSNDYTLTSSDVGKRIRSRVTAKNAAGSTTHASNPTAVVAGKAPSGPPVNTSEPRISGTPQAGKTLSATSGTWTGQTPITLSYQWTRCGTDGGKADASNCANVGGATRATYVLTSTDVGRRIRVKVTAKNAKGSKLRASNPTGVVQGAPVSGVINLPNGEKSIPVSSVPKDQRLIVDRVNFTPNPVRSRKAPIRVRVKVKDTRGFVVRNASVFLRSTPLVTTTLSNNGRTATDGWITYTVQPQNDFPKLNPAYNVQFFVKAFRQGDPALAGVAAYRLVQVRLGR